MQMYARLQVRLQLRKIRLSLRLAPVLIKETTNKYFVIFCGDLMPAAIARPEAVIYTSA